MSIALINSLYFPRSPRALEIVPAETYQLTALSTAPNKQFSSHCGFLLILFKSFMIALRSPHLNAVSNHLLKKHFK